MSDNEADRPPKADASTEAPLPEIEITPEMFDAAVDELRLHDHDYDLRGTVEAMLAAMAAAAPRSLGFRLRRRTDPESQTA
jgi:hypothetical protein